MFFTIQDFLLRRLYPARKLAWPLLILGALTFPGMIAVAVVQPDLRAEQLFIGLVAGLGILMMGILLSISRLEPPPKQGFGNRLMRVWESLVFLGWLLCLVVFLSLAVKIITFSG